MANLRELYAEENSKTNSELDCETIENRGLGYKNITLPLPVLPSTSSTNLCKERKQSTACVSKLQETTSFIKENQCKISSVSRKISRCSSRSQDDGVDNEVFHNFEENFSFYNGSSRSDSAIDLSPCEFERTSSMSSTTPSKSCCCRCQCHLPEKIHSSTRSSPFKPRKLQTSISLPLYSNGSYRDPSTSSRQEPWVVLHENLKSSPNSFELQGVTAKDKDNSSEPGGPVQGVASENNKKLVKTDSDYGSRMVECSSTTNLMLDNDKDSNACCSVRCKGMIGLTAFLLLLAVGTLGFVLYFVVFVSASNSGAATTASPTTPSLVHNQSSLCGAFPRQYVPASTSFSNFGQNPTVPPNTILEGRRILESISQAADDPEENHPSIDNRSFLWESEEFFRMPYQNEPLKRQIRVVGGEEASIKNLPWQAVLWLKENYRTCGASVILKNWAITAAHCIHHQPEKYMLFMGMTALSNRLKAPAENRNITEIIIHEKYMKDIHGAAFDYDVALLKMESGVEFSDYIQPICLPPQDFSFPPGKECYVSGWGGTNAYALELPDKLQVAQVDIISNETCSQWLGKEVPITDRMLCAGKEKGLQDACWGDSGGPLSCYDSNRGVWTLGGSVSFGFKCGLPKIPGIYANMGDFTDWIWSTIGQNEGWLPRVTTTFKPDIIGYYNGP